MIQGWQGLPESILGSGRHCATNHAFPIMPRCHVRPLPVDALCADDRASANNGQLEGVPVRWSSVGHSCTDSPAALGARSEIGYASKPELVQQPG